MHYKNEIFKNNFSLLTKKIIISIFLHLENNFLRFYSAILKVWLKEKSFWMQFSQIQIPLISGGLDGAEWSLSAEAAHQQHCVTEDDETPGKPKPWFHEL